MIIVLSVILVIVCFIICVVAVLKKKHDLKELQEARLRKDDQPTENTNTNIDLVGAMPTSASHKANIPSDTGGLIMNDAIAIEKPIATNTNEDLIDPDQTGVAIR